MKFTRMGRYEFQVTARKIAFIERRKRREQQTAPLFADQIAEAQASEPTPEQEMETRRKRFNEQIKIDRKRRAEDWLRARRALRGLSQTDREAVLLRYNGRWMPAEPCYLLDLIHCQMRGTR